MLADGLAEAFQLQAGFCHQMGSPIYAEILARCGDDLAAGGIIAQVLDGWVGRAVPDAVVLRLTGAVHRLALRGDAPGLARFYPSTGGRPEFPAAWEAFRDVVAGNFDYIRKALQQQVQTNEVSRCAALLGGFLYLADKAPLPLRLLEIGSSAGLNQNWDRYRYERDGAYLWGNPASPVTIGCKWHGEPPSLAPTVNVASRAGCDIAPLDVSDNETALRLQSFVWPDQLERLQPLRSAMQLARQYPPTITKSTAPAWLASQLKEPHPGCRTIVFHSIMWWYMSHEERDQVTQIIEDAGGRASDDAPLGWLQLEISKDTQPRLTARQWPGGEEVLMGHAHAHGSEVWWEANLG